MECIETRTIVDLAFKNFVDSQSSNDFRAALSTVRASRVWTLVAMELEELSSQRMRYYIYLVY